MDGTTTMAPGNDEDTMDTTATMDGTTTPGGPVLPGGPGEDILLLMTDECEILFKEENPHKPGTQKNPIYAVASKCLTTGDAKKKGASLWDIKEWYKKGYVRIKNRGEGFENSVRNNVTKLETTKYPKSALKSPPRESQPPLKKERHDEPDTQKAQFPTIGNFPIGAQKNTGASNGEATSSNTNGGIETPGVNILGPFAK